MSEQKNTLSTLFAACWKDDALKARFITDPKAVLAEHGIDVPDRVELRVVENTDDCVHITLPKPPSDHGDLSDEELEAAAGGASMGIQAMQYQRKLMSGGS
ncbi:MAG: hypothetical protein RLZZ461_889 [Planctomycetota bacterium]|jgi:hypothetical protein